MNGHADARTGAGANTPPMGRADTFLGPTVGNLVGAAYGAAVRARNRRFDAGRGVVRAAVPVISIGNLSFGGTGKTPLTAWVVGVLREAGIAAGIAMRGYVPTGCGGGGRAEGSDEAAEYRRLLPGVPVLVGADRARCIAEHLRLGAAGGETKAACIVLDDGFQHRRLARDLDIVLLDATRPASHDRLFPRGWLREPVESLVRAHAVVVTHAEAAPPEAVATLAAWARGLGPRGMLVATARHAWVGLAGLGETGEGAGEPPLSPVGAIAGKRVVVACAIGNPGPFLARARAAAEVVGEAVFRDHAGYGARELAEIAGLIRAGRADAVITTEKDWSKLAGAAAERLGVPVVRARLDVDVDDPDGGLRRAVLATAAGEAG
jgi:tetraacyldisaccharide 4'-kinase